MKTLWLAGLIFLSMLPIGAAAQDKGIDDFSKNESICYCMPNWSTPNNVVGFDNNWQLLRAMQVPRSKKAILHYKLIAASENYHLLEINLLTGRHHQIRCQLAEMGCPIKGDLKYGAARSNPGGEIDLLSHHVSFVHPVSKELIELTSPLPDDLLWHRLAASVKP